MKRVLRSRGLSLTIGTLLAVIGAGLAMLNISFFEFAGIGLIVAGLVLFANGAWLH